jgi:hypothetical protein
MNQESKAAILREIAKEEGIPLVELWPAEPCLGADLLGRLPMPSATSLTERLRHVKKSKPKPFNGNTLIKQQVSVVCDCAEKACTVQDLVGMPYNKEVRSAIKAVRKYMEESK